MVRKLWRKLIRHALWISRSTRGKRWAVSICFLLLLGVSFMHSCSTCSVQKAPAAELSVGLRQLAVPQQRFAVQTTEATADVHKFLCKFHKLAKQRGYQPHTKAYHRWRQQQVWTVLSARQKLAYSLRMVKLLTMSILATATSVNAHCNIR